MRIEKHFAYWQSNSDNYQNTLRLPLIFPPNVRVVLSATVAGSEKFITVQDSRGRDNILPKRTTVDLLDSDKKPRIIIEMERRKWSYMYVNPLEQVRLTPTSSQSSNVMTTLVPIEPVQNRYSIIHTKERPDRYI